MATADAFTDVLQKFGRKYFWWKSIDGQPFPDDRIIAHLGFALETGTRAHVVAEARRKLREKKCDVVVANEARVAFGGDDNEISFVTENRDERLPRAAKVELADALLDRIKSLLG